MKRHPETLQTSQELIGIHQNFLTELRTAHAATIAGTENRTSLPFIVNPLPSSPIVQEDELFTTLVFGGTLGTKALCRKTKSGIEIISQNPETALPHFTRGEDFLAYVEDATKDDPSAVIGVNFAYAASPVFERGRLDSVLLEADPTNAVDASDLVGKKIGEEIERYILEKRGKKVTVSVGNDGICLLLSGKTLIPGDNLAFGVVGTGLNAGFLLDKNTAVNLESNRFDKFPQTKVGEELTRLLGNPFGKEINGACLYRHFNAEIEDKGIQHSPLTSTRQLSELSQTNIPVVSGIAQKHLDRSAQLVACQTAAIADFKGQDTVFVMEGSLFWKGHNYKETVAKTVRQLTSRRVTFVEIPNSGVVGAAKLVA